MGRQKYNKRNHIEKSNIILENNYSKSKGLLTEQQATLAWSCNGSQLVSHSFDANMVQLGFTGYWASASGALPVIFEAQLPTGAGYPTMINQGLYNQPDVTLSMIGPQPSLVTQNQAWFPDDYPGFMAPGVMQGIVGDICASGGTTTTGCDLSCVDLSDPATDGMVAQGGGPNSIQSYDPSATYAPGSVVCHLDPALGVTNVFIASANSGNLVPGGGQYPEPQQWVTAWPWPLPPGASSNDYYWEPGVILATCGGNGNWQGGQGDWWCPTGVAGPGPCIQSPTNPQPGMATGPYPDQQTCDAQCGGIGQVSGCLDPNLPNYDPNATLDCSGNPQPAAGYGDTNCCGMPPPPPPSGGCMELWVTKCAGSSPGFQIGQSNLHFPCPHVDGAFALPSLVGQEVGIDPTTGQGGDDVYTVDQVNPNPSYPQQYTPNSYLTTNVSCTTNPANASCDFSWASTCAQSELNTGGQNSWQNFLDLRETGFNGSGCQHLQNVVNWTTDQLNSGVTGAGAPLTPNQIARKTEQREWAQCQASECGCSTLNLPALTGGPTPPPPTDPDLIDPEVPTDKPKKPKPGEEEGLNEQFTRMKELWKYNKL
jgi:hypothetical protein